MDQEKLTLKQSSSSLNSRQVINQDAQRFSNWLLIRGEGLSRRFFAITQEAARLRGIVLLGGAFILWIALAYLTHPPELSGVPVNEIPMAFISPFFRLDILRHVLVGWVVYWLSFRVAAVYLDDIFEINDVSVASRYINQSAFASSYDRITIREGGISKRDLNSPIFRIGGPGLVRVHLENAALFERVDGSPHIIGPSSKSVPLEGFERIREVIDLRDQDRKSLEVEGRTRDGIPVIAKDIRIVFSVYRGSNKDRINFRQPYPYTVKAIQNLIYKQKKGDWTQAIENKIKSRLRNFISQHTLSEFLSNVSPEEMKEAKPGAQSLEWQSDFGPQSAQGEYSPGFAVEPGLPDDFDLPKSPSVVPPSGSDFISRDEITESLYAFAQHSAEGSEERGFELQWIGVGTWLTPEIIQKRHLEAWEKTIQNRIEGSENTLKRLRRESRLKELLRLIQDVPINSFGVYMNRTQDSEKIKLELLLAYREKLRSAQEFYLERGQSPSPKLNAALEHLSNLTTRWLGKNDASGS